MVGVSKPEEAHEVLAVGCSRETHVFCKVVAKVGTRKDGAGVRDVRREEERGLGMGCGDSVNRRSVGRATKVAARGGCRGGVEM